LNPVSSEYEAVVLSATTFDAMNFIKFIVIIHYTNYYQSSNTYVYENDVYNESKGPVLKVIRLKLFAGIILGVAKNA
jgi:hypothetical protein